jgi:hypothetical protein
VLEGAQPSACWVVQTARVTTSAPDADEDEDQLLAPEEWLLLVYRVPSEPTRLRAAVWRRLKSLGAVYLQNSAAVLPAGRGAERALRRLRREILDMEGTAVLLSCTDSGATGA